MLIILIKKEYELVNSFFQFLYLLLMENSSMSSASEYRPKDFNEMIGQDAIVKTLSNAIDSQKIPQALLFCGPRGVGKTSCARILAKKINDLDENFEYNIFELDAASNNSVEDIRNITEQIRIPPQYGKFKVYIIDEVHMLSNAAFNAFLKSLEEPPPHVVFILATTEKNKIIPTILSRCQIYDFKKVDNSSIIGLLNKICNEKKIKDLFNSCSVCINLIGILYEKNKNQFNKIHSQLPHLLSKLAKEKKIDQFIHVSALGVENAIDSDYAKSKFDGENFVKKNFKSSVILKPSIVYSIDDNFTTSFMTLLNRLPIMPLYYNGDTKFFPIHVSDLTEIIFQTIVNEIKSETIECIGPEELSFKEIIKKLLKAIDKKRLLIPVPLPIAKISAFLLGLLPRPLLTSDQLKLLKYNNVPSNKYKTNFDLGFKANKKFEIEIEKYSYNWRSGGEYTRNKDLKVS